jgi:hypothetical protein
MAGFAPNDRDFAIVAVRWLLGVQSLLSGLNWWVKILPFPNINEVIEGPIKHEILATMIESGWMFSSAKAIEVLLGLALILNRHAVLMLVVSFPVMLMTFLLDLFPFLGNVGKFAGGEVSGAVVWHSMLDMLYFGAGVFLMQAYLMSEYFAEYRSLFVARPDGVAAEWSGVFEAAWLKFTLRWLSYTVGATSTIWAVLMVLGIVEWSSLAVLAPPH